MKHEKHNEEKLQSGVEEKNKWPDTRLKMEDKKSSINFIHKKLYKNTMA